MAAVHGRSGVLYLGPTNGAAAVNVSKLNTWTINYSTDQVEVTAFGDSNKTYVAGLPDASGSFAGFWDSGATSTFQTAARDGQSRKMYLYPDGNSARYWYGDVLLDFSATAGVSAAVQASANFSAASAITPVGI